MIVSDTALAGVWLLELGVHEDERGAFFRTFDREALLRTGLQFDCSVVAISTNAEQGTLRGLHYQRAPVAQTKVVTCTRGRVYDVVADLRPDSATRHQWIATELSGSSRTALVVPPGFAHGFLTLEADSHVMYHLAGDYSPAHADGARWDDAALAIDWPSLPTVISEQDASWPELNRYPKKAEEL